MSNIADAIEDLEREYMRCWQQTMPDSDYFFLPVDEEDAYPLYYQIWSHAKWGDRLLLQLDSIEHLIDLEKGKHYIGFYTSLPKILKTKRLHKNIEKYPISVTVFNSDGSQDVMVERRQVDWLSCCLIENENDYDVVLSLETL